MNVKQRTCAPKELRWHNIDWKKAHYKVKKLQVRIAKAVKAGRYNKVKALQWILTHSFSAKVIAVKRVTENRGKETAGVDGIKWSTPKAKAEAVKELKRRGYRPQPLKRIYIPKEGGKRPLSIPVMKDRGMQALYLQALEPVAETLGDNNSYGFRKERSAADAIGQCFNILNRGSLAEWIFEGDISNCFSSISYDWLMKHIPIDKGILEKWLKSGYMEKGKLFPTSDGTPQGSIISPVLANMVLDGLEEKLKRKFPYKSKMRVYLVRYADDFGAKRFHTN
jgi:RNA-directed DNA polymerase